jgi:hypothetical protein
LTDIALGAISIGIGRCDETPQNPSVQPLGKEKCLEDDDLCNAAREMAEGLYEADLGGGLFKKRIARSGQGKSGGFRTMIASNRKDRWVFLYGFAKNERSNISGKEREALRKLAGDLLIATPKTIETMTLNNKLMEVGCDEEN